LNKEKRYGKRMKLILLGAPGAGKGTQAEAICSRLGIPAISTGTILRKAVREGTPVGLRAKALIEAGRLVPDDVIIGIVQERLAADDCKSGYVLDGVPRTIAQAEALEKAGVDIDAALLLDVPDSVIEARLTGRRVCAACSASYHIKYHPPKKEGVCDLCGGEVTTRKDDLPETVRRRLEVYHRETEPLIGFYAGRGKLIRVTGDKSLEETTEEVLKALKDRSES